MPSTRTPRPTTSSSCTSDYANHTLVVPRADVGYQHVTMFIYLTDVTPETAATRVVSREHTAGIPIERTYLHLEEYAHLYELEEPASGPAGSVFVYRPDVFHRGVPLATPRAARFTLNVAFKPAATDWIGFHAFPVRAEDMAWHRFMRHATVRQLTMLGFPEPGDAYWTPETLAGVAARYPSLDMSPWRDARPRGIGRLGLAMETARFVRRPVRGRRVPTTLAGVVAVALAFAACGSAGTGKTGSAGTPSTLGGPAASTSLGVGVTATSMKVGVSLIDFSCVAAYTNSIRVRAAGRLPERSSTT